MIIITAPTCYLQALDIKEKEEQKLQDKADKKQREWDETNNSRLAQIARKQAEKRHLA